MISEATTPAMLLAAVALAVAGPSPQALAREVQAYYDRTVDLEASFVQTYTYAAFGRRQVSKGKLLLKQPGMLRWDYESPSAKSVVIRGTRFQQWEPDANQLYEDDRFDAAAASAAVTFLVGRGDLAKEFHLSVDADGWLRLTPKKPDPLVASISLQVGSRGAVTATRVRDAQGNVNELRLEKIRRNIGLKSTAFELKIPSGARRIGPGQGP